MKRGYAAYLAGKPVPAPRHSYRLAASLEAENLERFYDELRKAIERLPRDERTHKPLATGVVLLLVALRLFHKR